MSILVGDKPILGNYCIEIDNVSFKDYLSFNEEDISCELRGGKVIITPPANFEHETIFKIVLVILDSIGKSKSIGGAIGSRFMVKLNDEWAPELDVIFYSNKNKQRIKPTYFEGGPDLVVEILSPSNR
ncbi:MAG: Uma2 family endonuclease [Candidatus Heimdallarchaeota archaeon]|nr:Uma2 family endonuclease [Candidatus Heimdallarchaeota archaeon]